MDENQREQWWIKREQRELEQENRALQREFAEHQPGRLEAQLPVPDTPEAKALAEFLTTLPGDDDEEDTSERSGQS
jgi:hypothetical protein